MLKKSKNSKMFFDIRVVFVWTLLISVIFTNITSSKLYAENIPLPTRTLKLGMSGDDVLNLQKILNQDADTLVAINDAGSKGNETKYFGTKTRSAVMKFQKKYASNILTPVGLTNPTGVVGQQTIKQLTALTLTQNNNQPQGGGAGVSSNPNQNQPNTPPPQQTNPTPTTNNNQTQNDNTSTIKFSCTFANSPEDCGFHEQSKVENSKTETRAKIVNIGRDGQTSVLLHTEPGDNNVHSSGRWERNDLQLSQNANYCTQGKEEWWAMSIMFPDDFVFPPGPEAGVIMDFHDSKGFGLQNFEIQTIPGSGLRGRGYGGSMKNGGKYEAVFADPYGAQKGNVKKNVWYDFVFHVKWSSNSDGLMEVWLNGKKVLTHNGYTLYVDNPCYLKLANYHAAFGKPSSIIYDRIIRGTTAESVSLTPLEGR